MWESGQRLGPGPEMSIERWSAFVVTWLVVSGTPGPNAAFSVAVGLANPLPRAFLAPLGIGVAALVHVVGASIGISAVLTTLPQLFPLVKWLGVAYLLWLGVRRWRRPLGTHSQDSSVSRNAIFARGVFVSLANPKAILAYAAVLPHFVSARSAFAPQLAILGITASIVATGVYCVYVALATAFREFMLPTAGSQRVDRIAGGTYVLAAAALASIGH